MTEERKEKILRERNKLYLVTKKFQEDILNDPDPYRKVYVELYLQIDDISDEVLDRIARLENAVGNPDAIEHAKAIHYKMVDHLNDIMNELLTILTLFTIKGANTDELGS